MFFKNVFWVFLFSITLTTAELYRDYDRPQTRVNKCCEPYEILVDSHCVHINETNETIWHPIFTSENGKSNIPVEYM